MKCGPTWSCVLFVQRLLCFLLPQEAPSLPGGCLLRKDEIMHLVDWLILELERSETRDSEFCEVGGISGIFGFYCSLAAVTLTISLFLCPQTSPPPRIAVQPITHLFVPTF